MPELDYLEEPQTTSNPSLAPARRLGIHHVAACVDSTSLARKVLAHAMAVAEAMSTRLSVVRVLEPPATGEPPPDPVDWDLRRRAAKAQIDRLVENGDSTGQIDSHVVQGPAGGRICQWALENKVDLTVLGECNEADWTLGRLGGTARWVIESSTGSVMLVPATASDAAEIRYRRLMVPLDCSSRAECALPVATRIAEAHGAEVLLVHAVPTAGLTEVGPLEIEDLELRDRIRRRNERVAHHYLNLIRARIPMGAPARIRLLNGDDPRHDLARAASDEGVDLIILSRCGSSGHSDIPVGSTAEFLMTHTTMPILLLRGAAASAPPLRRSRFAPTLRMPGQALT